MTSVQEIVEGIYLEAQSIDSIFRNKERYLMYKYAKDGLKKLNLTFAQNLKGMNFNIPISCKVSKPLDFQQFVRAYLINCDGKKIELKRATDIPESIFHYIVNCDGSVLDDCENGNLYDDCLVCNKSDDTCIDYCVACDNTRRFISSEYESLVRDLEKYKDSWIKENPDNFEFSGDLEGLAVVIEYIGNQIGSMTECQLMVKEDLVDVLEYYIRYKLLENGEQTVRQAEYYNGKFKARRNAVMSSENAVTINDLNRIMLIR